MGNTLAPYLESFYSAWMDWSGTKESRILLLGLDNAGKTTLLYRLKLGETEICTIPTVGFNVETFRYQSVEFTAWDVGGQCKLRPLWRHYVGNTDALVYIVDASDRWRLEEARHELHGVLELEELRNAKLLVFANKQDLPNAASPQEVYEILQLSSLARTSHVQAATARCGDGIYGGLDWLTKTLT